MQDVEAFTLLHDDEPRKQHIKRRTPKGKQSKHKRRHGPKKNVQAMTRRGR